MKNGQPKAATATRPVADRKRSADKPQARAAALDTSERVTSRGGIRVENEPTLRRVPLFYYAERGQWFAGDGRGNFAKISDSMAKSLLAEHGFNKNAKDSVGNTPADRAMVWLAQNKRVAFAGLLAGYPAGVHDCGGVPILVTESPSLITPKPGNCAALREFVESLLHDEEHDQITVFYLWLSESLRAFYQRILDGKTGVFRHCPALGLFGPRGCGKTALIELVLKPLFGGRMADPMTYLGEGRFNDDLFAASLLVLDDKGASANLAERRQRGEGIKDLIWKPEQRMEAKQVKAVYLRPFWRLVIAGNDDDAGLQVCPALSPSLEDKLLLLRTRPAKGLPTTHQDNDRWAARLRAELPAFAAWLLTWTPPEGVQLDPRTRVPNFQHPQLVAALRELQPEMRLLELIDTLLLAEGDTPCWEGTASDFENAMRKCGDANVLDRLFSSSTSAGRLLSELARVVPDRVQHTMRNGRSFYRIFRPT